MAAATREKPTGRARKPRKPRKMFMPYDPAAVAIVQPPAELAHLTGDALFEALTNAGAYRRATGREPAKWYSARFRAEVGRSEGRFKVWMSNHYAVREHGVDPATIDDRIMCRPDDYDKRSPWWYETTARAWAIAEGLMTRGGVMVPYKPTGRPKGRTDSVPRQRTATMLATALAVLGDFDKLTGNGSTAADAQRTLAARLGLTERQIKSRVTAGRAMRRAGVTEITPDTPPAEAARSIVNAYQLLMSDGRRSNAEHARAEVAERLGVERETVDTVLEQLLKPAPAPAEQPRNYEAEQLRAEMEAAIVVDSITRGTKPLHPGT
jgi:hypothetical protein